MKSNTSGRVRSIFVHLVLIFLSFLCLFFFYILIVNATRSHADLQKGFSALPGKYLWQMTEVSRCSAVFLTVLLYLPAVLHFVHIFLL